MLCLHSLSTPLLALSLLATGSVFGATTGDYPIQPVPFTGVKITGGFWAPRMETNHKVTVPYSFQKCEETGRISNFAKAGGLMEGDFEGIYFNDSDVFKIIEGAAYCLSLEQDPKLEAYVDDVIDKIAAAQEEDGYLYTHRTLNQRKDPSLRERRWEDLGSAHELYNIGHMYEAAVAYYQATGKRKFLDVAIKSADLVDQVFGPDKKIGVPGHEEIEIGLARLYRATGEERYLTLAKFFLDMRGRADKRKIYGDYAQDHKPVVEQAEAVGHAVRAGYLYAGMADVAALTGDQDYISAIGRIWEDVVSGKLALTGGIGARHAGEAFGERFELPNKTAYNETCAAIANAMWNHRLFLLHGDGKYMDVVERIIYNGFLSGVSFSGDLFFYPNPLESDGRYAFNQGATERKPWFGCSCCPANIARFVPSIPGYAYAVDGSDIFVNLYLGGRATITTDRGAVQLLMETEYPWDGRVRVLVEPEKSGEFELRLRIPGWALNTPAPGGLYAYQKEDSAKPSIKVNDQSVPLAMEKGFALVRRSWKKGDTVDLNLPMAVRRVLCHENVKDNVGKVAFERGPIVYCFEDVDQEGSVLEMAVPDMERMTARYRDDVLQGLVVLTGAGFFKERGDDNALYTQRRPVMAVPYYAWNHRGAGGMAVWVHQRTESLPDPPKRTIASQSVATASHCGQNDTITAIQDQAEPKDSGDHSIARLTFWPHKGQTEWIEYAFAKPTLVAGAGIYWFDDTGSGQCRVPTSWKLLYKAGDNWLPVKTTTPFGVAEDQYNEVTFEAVETTGLRAVIELQADFSGGVLEWIVMEEK